MAEQVNERQEQSICDEPRTERSTTLTTKECLDGLVDVTSSMEKRLYIVPQYPTLSVELLHVIVTDKGNKYDCFLEIKSDQKLPEIPGEVYVEKGFFLQVIVHFFWYSI